MTKLPLDVRDRGHFSQDPEERDDAIIGTALKWSLGVLIVLAAIGGTAAWWLTRPEPPPPVQETTLAAVEVRAAPQIEIPKTPFTDITKAAGIDFVHENGGTGEKLLPETMGSGGAFFDLDADGDQDLLLVNSCRWPWDTLAADSPPTTMALYQNDGTGQFVNLTTGSGLDVSFYGTGVAAGDYNNDGLVDLFISAVGANHLFHNAGGGKFRDVTTEANIAGADDTWSTSCGWFDYDRDGDLDLFVANYVGWSREHDAAQNFQLTGGSRAYGRPQNFEGTLPYLYRNDGEGRFIEVAEEAGLCVLTSTTHEPMAKSLGVTFADFDGDGWLDIIAANDTVQNFLFHNLQNGTFEEIGALVGVAFDMDGNARGAMGIDVARFRNNDALGVAIGNFSNEMTALYVSEADRMMFMDEAISTGLGPNTRLQLTFGLCYVDFDLDGRQDLFAANGHLEEEINRVQPSQHYEQPPQLFWNCGPQHSTEFLPVTEEYCGEDLLRPMVGRGASYADIDGDGDLDLLITAVDRPPRLLRNDQHLGHHWLRLNLRGVHSNRDAIGAVAEVHLPDRVLRQQVMPTRSYQSQVELPLTFGLGDTDRVDHVEIHWPDGVLERVDITEVDRLYEVVQTVP